MPSLTEICYAVGAEDKLIGVSQYCDYPPQVSRKEILGDMVSVNLEKLSILKPDIILLSSPTQGQLSVDLHNAGFRVALFPDPQNLDDVMNQIQSVADTLGFHRQGKNLVDSLLQELAEMESGESLSVYIELAADPLMTIGGTSFITGSLNHIGLYNIFADKKTGYPVISPEQVLARAPQVVLFLYPDAGSQIPSRIGWEELPASRSGLIFDDLPVDELLRPGPRLPHALHIIDSLVKNAQ